MGYSSLVAKRQSLHKIVADLNKEQRALLSTISQKEAIISEKNIAIDSILDDFQFTLD